MVPALLNDLYVIRFAICSQNASESDVIYAWNVISASATELLAGRRESSKDGEREPGPSGPSALSFESVSESDDEVFNTDFDDEFIFDNQRAHIRRAHLTRSFFFRMISDPKSYHPPRHYQQRGPVTRTRSLSVGSHSPPAGTPPASAPPTHPALPVADDASNTNQRASPQQQQPKQPEHAASIHTSSHLSLDAPDIALNGSDPDDAIFISSSAQHGSRMRKPSPPILVPQRELNDDLVCHNHSAYGSAPAALNSPLSSPLSSPSRANNNNSNGHVLDGHATPDVTSAAADKSAVNKAMKIQGNVTSHNGHVTNGGHQ